MNIDQSDFSSMDDLKEFIHRPDEKRQGKAFYLFLSGNKQGGGSGFLFHGDHSLLFIALAINKSILFFLSQLGV